MRRGQDGEANPVKVIASMDVYFGVDSLFQFSHADFLFMLHYLQNWQNEFINWTTETSQSLTEVSSSLAGMQVLGFSFSNLIGSRDICD